MHRQVDERTIRSLRHVLLKARGPGRGTELDYEKAYAFWLEMWRSTFAEVDPSISLTSDTFVNQRELSAVFLRDQVIGLMMYDFRDLRSRAHRDLGYFQHFPRDVVDQLGRYGQGQVMMMGQLTVHPDWRRSKVGPIMSDLLVGLSVKRFLSSAAPVMVAFTRNDRGTQHLGYRFGAVPLREGHEAYGIRSDVIAFYRDRMVDSSLPGLAELTDRLWTDTSVARLFSNMPPALEKSEADNDLVVMLNHNTGTDDR
jgi:hypothetical protein